MKFATSRGLGRSAAVVFVMAVLAVTWMAADAPPGRYFNGFEQNTSGWFNFSGGTITRRPSLYSNGGGYACSRSR